MREVERVQREAVNSSTRHSHKIELDGYESKDKIRNE